MSRQDASLLALTPGENHPYTVFDVLGREGMLDDIDFVPPQLQPQMKVHLYPIEDYISDLMMLPNFTIVENALDMYRLDGVTHLALLSLPCDDGPLMRWGHEEFKMGFVLHWCAAHNKYRLLHCAGCAQTVGEWVAEMQPEWGLNVVGEAIQKTRPTYH